MQLAIVRAMTTIDEDGDAAWFVEAASNTTHTLRQLLADWTALTAPPLGVGEGVGVASPLLFIASGAPAWARHQARALQREAAALVERLQTGQSDLADELTWLHRALNRRGARFDAERWRALALGQLLVDEEIATLAQLEGAVADDLLVAFYAVPDEADAGELVGLAERALEAWLYLRDG